WARERSAWHRWAWARERSAWHRWAWPRERWVWPRRCLWLRERSAWPYRGPWARERSAWRPWARGCSGWRTARPRPSPRAGASARRGAWRRGGRRGASSCHRSSRERLLDELGLAQPKRASEVEHRLARRERGHEAERA